MAGKALKANITTLGPLVLPLSEQLRFAANWLARRGLGMKLAPYLPNFTCVAFLPASAKSPRILLECSGALHAPLHMRRPLSCRQRAPECCNAEFTHGRELCLGALDMVTR